MILAESDQERLPSKLVSIVPLIQAPAIFSFVNLCSSGNAFNALDAWWPSLM